MKLEYNAYEDGIQIDERTIDDRRIKDPIVMTFRIEISKKKYESMKQRFETSIVDRIVKLFNR